VSLSEFGGVCERLGESMKYGVIQGVELQVVKLSLSELGEMRSGLV
jgi:hypothetical protein